jgi:hypothetical protein
VHQSILSFARKRYLWLALGLAALSIGAYAVHRPMSPPNGGSWLGYTLGSIAAALILWLTALGIRKRRYQSTLGTVQGWVSAHVYLGLALLVVATLHTGFQFGWNVHTVAYGLMVLVIASGIVGVVAYVRLPQQMSANRGNFTREQMLAELGDLDARAIRVAQGLPAAFRDAAQSNRDRTRIGGSVLAVLTGADRSQALLPTASGGATVRRNPDQSELLDWLGAELARSTVSERTQSISELISVVGARRVVLRRLRRDAQVRAWLQIWLYVHVPATLALLAALIAHVVSVFLYW